MASWNENGLDTPDLLSGGAYILVSTTYTIESNSTTVLLTVQNIGIASSRFKVIGPNILFPGFGITLRGQIIRFPDQMTERQTATFKSSATANLRLVVLTCFT